MARPSWCVGPPTKIVTFTCQSGKKTSSPMCARTLKKGIIFMCSCTFFWTLVWLAGWSVSLFDDGKTIAIGAYQNGDNSGHVRVYRMSDSETEWTQLGVDIDGGQTAEGSGWSVSISGDGNTVAIGSPDYDSDDGYDVGQVKVYIVE